MIGGMLRILVIGLVALVAAMMLMRPPPTLTIEAATVLDAPRTLPPATLIDRRGAPFALESLAGRDSIVFFGFTNCPDICPLTLAVIADAMGRLRASGVNPLPQVVFVSVDPERDSPERIGAYLDGFDPEFIGLTADDATLAPLLDTLGVSVHKQVEGGASYNVVHTGAIFLLDESARWVALLGGSTHQAETLVNDYLALRAISSRT